MSLFKSPLNATCRPVETPLEKEYNLGRGDFIVEYNDGQEYLIRMTDDCIEKTANGSVDDEMVQELVEEIT